MSIPLDRLYNYIENVASKLHGKVVISRFWPHGSKNLQDLKMLRDSDWLTEMLNPNLICHDQEPLNFDLYQQAHPNNEFMTLLNKYECYQAPNLKRHNIFDKDILLHSELRSTQVEKYSKDQYIPVYYWSHGLIARDWFRFAQHIEQCKHIKKIFLVYNRAWSGTREYRARFAELLVTQDLVNQCQTKFNCVDPETNLHYRDCLFAKDAWKPSIDLQKIYQENLSNSSCSGDFELHDYESTCVEVVLETLFDDDRLHITEKTLRPIACAQPFILCATAGSLKYLQEYGFETYHSIWDENYDQIDDAEQRLIAVTDVMKQVQSWDSTTRSRKLEQARIIAEQNKKYFFSQEFFQKLTSELTANLAQGLDTLMQTNTSLPYLRRRIQLCKIEEIKNILIGRDHRAPAGPKEIMQMLTQVKKYTGSCQHH